jgi:hypothetical protein
VVPGVDDDVYSFYRDAGLSESRGEDYLASIGYSWRYRSALLFVGKLPVERKYVESRDVMGRT